MDKLLGESPPISHLGDFSLLSVGSQTKELVFIPFSALHVEL